MTPLAPARLVAPAAAVSDSAPDAAYEALLGTLLAAGAETFVEPYRAAVAWRVEHRGQTEPEAHIGVNRDLARRAVAVDAPSPMVDLYISRALLLARELQDADALIEIHLDQARQFAAVEGVKSARIAWDMVNRLQRSSAKRIEVGRVLADLLNQCGQADEADEIRRTLLALPGADRLAIEVERAERSGSPSDFAPQRERWDSVLQLATEAHRHHLAARALDHLADIDLRQGHTPAALDRFARAATLQDPSARGAGFVVAHAGLLREAGRAPEAIDLLHAARRGRPLTESGEHHALLRCTAELQAAAGDYRAAYASLLEADGFRASPEFRPPVIPFTRIAVTRQKGLDLDAAAQLAAVRNALREAELDRTRMAQRQIVGVAIGAVLLAALLGLAYLYKRRAATALAIARDNAELRADRSHWQMLRYQLNPHFLFNALSSLGGLVATDPPAAARVVDRLSEFCQLALHGSHDDLRPLSRELELLRAYLDVEQAGAGESLQIRWDIDPRATGYLLPTLMLQPLVENALKYGAQTSEDTLHLHIAARLDDQGRGVLVEIANSGAWVPPQSTPHQRPAVGLDNVRQRLARIGAEAGALTTRVESGWVRVRLHLPAS